MKIFFLLPILAFTSGCFEKPNRAKRTDFVNISDKNNSDARGEDGSKEDKFLRVGEITNGNIPPAHPGMGAVKPKEKNLEEADEENMLMYNTGADLYALHCSSCHGGLSGSPKRGSSLDSLVTAIDSDEVMSKIESLKDISDEDLELIIFALNFDPRTPENNLGFNYEISTGSRHYIHSKFVYLFATDNNDNQSAQMIAVLDESIKNQASVFGGPCRVIERDETCPIMDLDTAYLNISSTPSPLRAGYIQNSCDQVHAIPNNVAVNNVLAKLNLDTSSPINSDNIKLLLELYTHKTDFNDAVVNALAGIGTQAAAIGLSNAEAWNHISAASCSSTVIDML